VDMTMWSLSLHGLSEVRLEDVRVERNSDLSEVRARVLVHVNKLLLNGFYNMEAISQVMFFSNISSEGTRDFSIILEDAILGLEVSLGIGSGCQNDPGALVKDIHFPLFYREIQFEFDNIGNVMSTAMDVIGDLMVENERNKLATIIKQNLQSEVPSIVCDVAQKSLIEEPDKIPYFDQIFQNILNKEKYSSELFRDTLAENLAKKIFNESVKKHMTMFQSPLRNIIDPFTMFPLELPIKNKLYKCTVETCNFHLHNSRKADLESVILVRDRFLTYSAWRVQFHMPLLWMTGNYFLRNGKFLKVFPFGGSGDFMIRMNQVKVAMTVVLRETDGGLQIEQFNVDAGWRHITFKFDGFLQGLGNLADKLMNELGIGNRIVERQKNWIIGEVKSYLKGMAVCMLWSPSMGIELCMRDYWINLGWEFPWVYPSCK